MNREQSRYEQLKRCIPDIFDAENLLYVGGHFHFGRDLQMTKYFKCPVDIVEAFWANANELRDSGRVNKVFLSDIREFTSLEKYEVTMFWHGPEHLEKSELPALIEKMKEYTTKYIVFAVPNGIYDQGAEYGNPYEVHRSHWSAKELEELGLNVDAIGEPDKRNGNIIAWISC